MLTGQVPGTPLKEAVSVAPQLAPSLDGGAAGAPWVVGTPPLPGTVEVTHAVCLTARRTEAVTVLLA